MCVCVNERQRESKYDKNSEKIRKGNEGGVYLLDNKTL